MTSLPHGQREPQDRADHNADPAESLHQALIEMGTVQPDPPATELLPRLMEIREPNRAFARGPLADRGPTKPRCGRSTTVAGRYSYTIPRASGGQ